MFYITKDTGRTHIAYEGQYLGNFNTYNNCLTKAWAFLFFRSKIVKINDRNVHVNFKSFKKFLAKLECDNGSLEIYRKKKFIPEDIIIPINNDKMHMHLSAKKKAKLTQKLIEKMINQKWDKARKKIGKGADVNHIFWIEEKPKVQRLSKVDLPFSANLPGLEVQVTRRVGRNAFTAISMTPLLFASYVKNGSLQECMLQAGGNPHFVGTRMQFNRREIDQQTQKTPTQVYETHPCYDPHFGSLGYRGYNGYIRHGTLTRTSTTYHDNLKQTHLGRIDPITKTYGEEAQEILVKEANTVDNSEFTTWDYTRYPYEWNSPHYSRWGCNSYRRHHYHF